MSNGIAGLLALLIVSAFSMADEKDIAKYEAGGVKVDKDTVRNFLNHKVGFCADILYRSGSVTKAGFELNHISENNPVYHLAVHGVSVNFFLVSKVKCEGEVSDKKGGLLFPKQIVKVMYRDNKTDEIVGEYSVDQDVVYNCVYPAVESLGLRKQKNVLFKESCFFCLKLLPVQKGGDDLTIEDLE